jgi:sugar lactone lactonase YvrE
VTTTTTEPRARWALLSGLPLDVCTDLVAIMDGTRSSPAPGSSLATTAQVFFPSDLARDPDGLLVIADRNNDRLRRIDGVGRISSLPLTGAAAAMDRPNSIAFDGDDTLWIVDFGNALIVQNTEAGVVTSESLTFASTPTALVVEQPGQLIVADANFHGIWRRTPTGPTLLAGGRAGTGSAGFSGDGRVAVEAQFQGPGGVALHDGVTYVADTRNHRVRRIANGIVTTIAGYGTFGPFDFTGGGDGVIASATRLGEVADVAVDATGDLYVAEPDRIRRIHCQAR